MNPYTVRFPNGAVHSTPTLAAALRYAARATRTTYPGGRGAPGMPSVYKGAAKLAACRIDYKRRRGPNRARGDAPSGVVVAVCKLLKAGKAELQRTRR